MIVSRRYLKILFAAVLFCTVASSAIAQTSFGRISGTATDPTGAGVAGAQILVRNTETQATRTVQTNSNGFYVVTDLPIGPYSVEINQQGFKRQSQTGLNLPADGRLTANFKLELGDVSQSVDVVTAAGETLNTVSGEVSPRH